jgi:hypothetical protein
LSRHGAHQTITGTNVFWPGPRLTDPSVAQLTISERWVTAATGGRGDDRSSHHDDRLHSRDILVHPSMIAALAMLLCLALLLYLDLGRPLRRTCLFGFA